MTTMRQISEDERADYDEQERIAAYEKRMWRLINDVYRERVRDPFWTPSDSVQRQIDDYWRWKRGDGV